MNCQDHLYRQKSKAGHAAVVFRAVRRRIGFDCARAFDGRERQRGAAVNPLALKQPHFAPKAKRVIFLFMAGAPSHLELFDNKPQLAKFDGTLPPPELLKGYRAAFINPNSKLLGPKFKFAKYGQSGAELSELLPHTGGDRRRHCDREVDGDGRVQSRAGPVIDEHGLAAVRPAEHGGVVAVRAGQRDAGFARRSLCSVPGRRGRAAAIDAGAAGSCRPSIRACSSAASGDPVLYLSNPQRCR